MECSKLRGIIYLDTLVEDQQQTAWNPGAMPFARLGFMVYCEIMMHYVSNGAQTHGCEQGRKAVDGGFSPLLQYLKVHTGKLPGSTRLSHRGPGPSASAQPWQPLMGHMQLLLKTNSTVRL